MTQQFWGLVHDRHTLVIHTQYWRKPIPSREYDWQATYENYDGADDSKSRNHIGFGPTEAEAIVNLVEQYHDTQFDEPKD